MDSQLNSPPVVLSVLLIDDSPEDRFTLIRLLRKNPSGVIFNIQEAGNGEDGSILFHNCTPDCLVLDYRLGDIDGLSLLEELNQGRDPYIDPICPAVILTGESANAETLLRALKNGAQDYLAKETLTATGFVRAIENAVEKVRLRREIRAAEDQLAFEQKQMEAERAEMALKAARIADAVQRSLLLTPAPDAYAGVTVEVFYQSAWDDALIGGDFFDVFAVSEEVVALVVGDATGKGVEAATYTAEVKFALRAYLREHHGDLTAAMRLLNDFVADNERLDAAHVAGAYVALAVALVNTRTGETVCCCAGAEPPLILRAATGEIVEANASGTLLGASEGAHYDADWNCLGMGDLIALTTDGLTEVRRPCGAFFGMEGLGDALRDETADPQRPLQEVKSAVVQRALSWASGRQHDDICLLLAKRREF